MGASRSHKGSHFWFLLVPFGSISVPFRFLLVPFRFHFGSFWFHFGSIWFLLVPFGSISVPFGSISVPFGSSGPIYDQILISYAQNDQIHVEIFQERHFLRIKKTTLQRRGGEGHWDYWGGFGDKQNICIGTFRTFLKLR